MVNEDSLKIGQYLVCITNYWTQSWNGAVIKITGIENKTSYKSVWAKDGIVRTGIIARGETAEYYQNFREATQLEILEAKLLGGTFET